VSLLCTAVPFIIASLGYWSTYRAFFLEELSQRPWAWQWRLTFPIFASTATPLVLVATVTGSRYAVPLAATVVAGLVTGISSMTLLSVGEGGEGEGQKRPEGYFFFNMRSKVKVFRKRRLKRVTWARVVFIIGLLIIVGQGATNVVVASLARSSDTSSPSAPVSPQPSRP
jgi:hypothetical protein